MIVFGGFRLPKTLFLAALYHRTALRHYVMSWKGKLRCVEAVIETLHTYQFIVSAGFNYPSIVDHVNSVCVLDCTESVSHNETGAALHKIPHRLPDVHLRSGVDIACSFIEYEYLGIYEHYPGDRQQLPLATAYAVAV